MYSKIYKTFDHTSDLGVQVFGDTIDMLFKNSIKTFNDLIIAKDLTGADKTREINLKSTDREMLLHDLLAEALYFFWSENLIITDIEFKVLKEKQLKAKVSLFDTTNKQIEIKREIKAVTYHQLEIGEQNDNFYARVVFDI